MTDDAQHLDRLGAMADEWIAERDMFLSSMHAYLHNHLQHLQAPPSEVESLPDDAYAAELAAIGDRLCQFARALDGVAWYQLRSRERLAEYRQTTESIFGPPAIADAQRLARLTPPAWAAEAHDALRRGVGLQHHMLQICEKCRIISTWACFSFSGASSRKSNTPCTRRAITSRRGGATGC